MRRQGVRGSGTQSELKILFFYLRYGVSFGSVSGLDIAFVCDVCMSLNDDVLADVSK